MKQLQRLLIQQGHKCFFCGRPIPEGEASVEHLDALSNGGDKTDQNCVACCRAFNTALNNLSIKEKIRVLLSQPNPFPCPQTIENAQPPTEKPIDTSILVESAIEILKRYGDKVPRRKTTLLNALRSQIGEQSEESLEAVYQALLVMEFIATSGVKITYPGLESGSGKLEH